jgi:hypothetical protein
VIFHPNLNFSVFRKTKSHLLSQVFIQVRDMKPMVPISAFWFWSIAFPAERQKTADSVEKVGFSAGPNAGTITIGETTHHIEWFLGSSLTFAALSLC